MKGHTLSNGLTVREERFAWDLAKGMSQSDAYRRNFDVEHWEDKSVWEAASRLASKVSPRVEQILYDMKHGLSVERVQAMLMDKALNSKRDADQTRAIELLGKSLGAFRDVQVNEGEVVGVGSLLSQLSKISPDAARALARDLGIEMLEFGDDTSTGGQDVAESA